MATAMQKDMHITVTAFTTQGMAIAATTMDAGIITLMGMARSANDPEHQRYNTEG